MSLNGKTILIVDDEAGIRELFKEELMDNGAKVLEAESGNKAFEVFKQGGVDAVISDIRMPDGDGVELVKNIKETNSDIPIYLITGFADYTGNELKVLGIEAIIFKPFDISEVIQMVEQKFI
ncbi:MAG: DNA-binding NtrC family response regulator [Bacteriovoracaceae bacterium]|jgi:DNA-binding NtrC family response regulator